MICSKRQTVCAILPVFSLLIEAVCESGCNGIVVELLYRTDFFPGLGWMLERTLWLELEPKWPITYVASTVIPSAPFISLSDSVSQ